MMSVKTSLSRVSAGIAALVIAACSAAQAASVDRQFNSAVNRMLMNMDEGAVSEMSEAEKKELVACVQKVFANIPDEKKEYIATASGQEELRARFDEVGLENKAALKQQVRDECS